MFKLKKKRGFLWLVTIFILVTAISSPIYASEKKLPDKSSDIEKIDINIQITGVDDRINGMIKDELTTIDSYLEKIVVNRPIHSIILASNLYEPILERMFRWKLPGFKAQVEMEAGSHLKIDTKLIPQGQLIEDIQLKLNSNSIPNFVLFSLEKMIESKLAIFYGMPVEFVDIYESYLLTTIRKEIKSQGLDDYIYLKGEPKLSTGQTTDLDMQLELSNYKIDLRSKLRIKKDSLSPAFNLSVGRVINSKLMLRLEDELILTPLDNNLSFGLDYSFNPQLKGSIDYRLQDSDLELAVNWRKDRYGLSLSQAYPGKNLKDIKIGVDYYPGVNSRISLFHQDNNTWLTLELDL